MYQLLLLGPVVSSSFVTDLTLGGEGRGPGKRSTRAQGRPSVV